MTILEEKKFYLLDNQQYILSKNNDILNTITKKTKDSFLTIEELQGIINEVTQFFEMKYPDNMLYKIKYIANKNTEEIKKSLKVSRLLDMKQMRFRIYHLDRFLDCPYASTFTLKNNQNELYKCDRKMIFVEEDGTIEERELVKLEGYLDDTRGISRMEDVLGRFIGNPNNIDYTELERFVINHRNSLELRNKILELIPLSMIYSKDSRPKYGYIRARHFIRMINKELNLNLTTDKIDRIMSIDYSNTKEIKQLAKRRNTIKCDIVNSK